MLAEKRGSSDSSSARSTRLKSVRRIRVLASLALPEIKSGRKRPTDCSRGRRRAERSSRPSPTRKRSFWRSFSGRSASASRLRIEP